MKLDKYEIRLEFMFPMDEKVTQQTADNLVKQVVERLEKVFPTYDVTFGHAISIYDQEHSVEINIDMLINSGWHEYTAGDCWRVVLQLEDMANLSDIKIFAMSYWEDTHPLFELPEDYDKYYAIAMAKCTIEDGKCLEAILPLPFITTCRSYHHGHGTLISKTMLEALFQASLMPTTAFRQYSSVTTTYKLGDQDEVTRS